MKMAAWSLLGCSTGMKSESALLNRQAREFQFLKSSRRHRRDLAPVFDGLWRGTSSVADFAIGKIVLKLKSEKFKSQGVEHALIGSRRPGSRQNDEIAQPRREFFKAGFCTHAVFIFPGWFSATARKQYVVAFGGNSKFQNRRPAIRSVAGGRRGQSCIFFRVSVGEKSVD